MSREIIFYTNYSAVKRYEMDLKHPSELSCSEWRRDSHLIQALRNQIETRVETVLKPLL